MKPLCIDLPYPSLSEISPKDCNLSLIKPLYCGHHGELTAILQYVYHVLYFENSGMEGIAKTLNEIALCEMKHLDVLGELIIKLGGDPVFGLEGAFNTYFYSTASVTYSKTPEKMIIDDVLAEMLAVKSYSYVIDRVQSEKVSAVLTRIKLDEELHVKALKDALEQVKNLKN